MRRVLLDQKGISLTEIVIAGGIMAAVSIGLMRTTSNMKFSNELFQTKTEEQLSFNHVSTQFLDAESCKNTLSGKTTGSTIDQIKLRGGKTLDLGSSSEFVNNSRIKFIKLESEDFSGCTTYPCVGTMTLNVQFERKIKGKIQDSVIKQIKLNVKKLAMSSSIDSCFASTDGTVDTAKEETCNLMGGSYTADPESCSFNSNTLGNNLNALTSKDSSLQSQINSLLIDNRNLTSTANTIENQNKDLETKIKDLESKIASSGSSGSTSGSGTSGPSCRPGISICSGSQKVSCGDDNSITLMNAAWGASQNVYDVVVQGTSWYTEGCEFKCECTGTNSGSWKKTRTWKQ